MYDQFKVKAEAVSADVLRFQTKGEALDFIFRFMREEGLSTYAGESAVWADGNFIEDIDKNVLEAEGIFFGVTAQRAAGARFGICCMDWAIADTGTLAHDSTSFEKRLVSTLPEIHIAILSAKAILPDLQSFIERVSPEKFPFISLITGPSRTADIERVLTIGVHGPRRLVTVFVDELEVNTDEK